MKKHKIFLTLFLFLSLIGFILTSVEFFYSLQGKSLCPTDGCLIVGSFARDDKALYLMGMIFFGSIIALLSFKKYFSYANLLIDILLMLGIAVEGYLVGFQVFVIQDYCLFCLTVAGIIFSLALIKIILKKNIVVSVGFAVFILIFASVWFINPGLKSVPESQYVLIYSENCPHCHKVIDFCKDKNIPVELVKVNDIKGFCKTANINTVPVLVCNCPDKKTILKGESNIINYFSELFVPNSAYAEKKVKEVKQEPKVEKNKKSQDSEPKTVKEMSPNQDQDSGFCPIFKQGETCGSSTF
ncbi:MAG: hypothetical protein QXY47_06245 [Thermoplasmata archaeon]